MKTADLLKEKMAAMKAGNKLKKDVLTNLISSLTYVEKDLGRPLEDDEVIQQLQKERKKLQEARDMAEGRPEAQAALDEEIAIVQSYLPAELSDEDLKAQVDQVLGDLAIERSPAQKGAAMQAAMKASGSQADGKRISQAVDAYLAGQ